MSADLVGIESAKPKEVAIQEGLSSYLDRVGKAVSQAFTEHSWVVAEIASINYRTTGHVYLDLIEIRDGVETAKCRATMFSSKAKQVLSKWEASLGGRPQSGMKLLLRLKAVVTSKFGLSLDVVDIDPTYTLGDMQAKVAKISEALRAKGLFDLQRNIAQPSGFWRVAVIAPEESAGLADFTREAKIFSQAGVCEFDYFHAVFQGSSAPESIQAAMKLAYDAHQSDGYDALCIIRGGGAKADLAWLNDLKLAAWVCRFPVPVFVGVGHEIDEGILDAVCHRSFGTPSKVISCIRSCLQAEASAGERFTDQITRLFDRTIEKELKHIASLESRASHHASYLLSEGQRKALTLTADFMSSSEALLARERLKLSEAKVSFGFLSAQFVERLRAKLELTCEIYDKLNPLNLLKRGFAMISDANGAPVTSAAQGLGKSSLRVHFADGSLDVKPVKPKKTS